MNREYFLKIGFESSESLRKTPLFFFYENFSINIGIKKYGNLSIFSEH